ncbi:hypothetical protein VTN96DRAFT_3838 [Rasamsonia emersonii]
MSSTATEIYLGSIMEARKVREPDKTTPFMALPIIDLSDIDSPDQSKRDALASTIYDACTQVGFFYIKNHGISRQSREKVTAEAGRFFKELCPDQKMRLSKAHSEYHLGYSPFKMEEKKGVSPIHWFEGFLFGREAVFDHVYGDKVGPSHDAHNQWPEEDELPDFKAALGSYFSELLTLSRKLARIFARSLNLDESFFDAMIDRPGCMMSLNYYPDRAPDQHDVNSAIQPHTDHQLFTILYQTQGANALEVANSDGVWVPMPPIEDTFVVNIGDALSIWTNDVFLFTLRRAVNSSRKERFSISFFFGANHDALMETLPSCVTETRPRKYQSITAGQHYINKMNHLYERVAPVKS